MVRMYFDILNRLDVDYECDGQTDGRQTDRMAIAIARCNMTRAKNCEASTYQSWINRRPINST